MNILHISTVFKHPAFTDLIKQQKKTNSVNFVFVELTETDAGSRCAAICAASIALADAGIIMKDMVSAVAVGKIEDQILADLDYQEEAYEDGPVSDIPVAMLHNTGEISLLQMDGEIAREDLIKALELSKKVLAKIYEIQKKALKERFNTGDKNA